jgi:hypothetical protein
MNTQTRIVHTLYDKNGQPYCESITSPTANTVRAKCILPPHKVIPVLFIPGIMGSNLVTTSADVIRKKLTRPVKDPESRTGAMVGVAWFPDDTGWAFSFGGKHGKERQLILDPAQTHVANLSAIPNGTNALFDKAPKSVQTNWKEEFKRRGWGTVMLSSYGKVLHELEYSLNRIYQNGQVSDAWTDLLASQGNKQWGAMHGFDKIAENELFKAADYWYPVYAVGYNWLKSNEDAGKYIAGKIDKITGDYRKLGYTCDKVILVTHSMGGLAGRAVAHSAMGKAESKILGIVHGEQPATGAAAAYKRVHAGFEASLNPIDAIVARTLGWSGAEVSAVFANAPGALQLLPCKLYPKEWLHISRDGKGEKAQDILKLPKADPYEEIYREKDQWWRLMNPDLIDPAGITPSLKSSWTTYIKQLALAEDFHDTLKDYYHSNTWVHYGADPKYKAWGILRWYPLSTISYVSNNDLVNAHLKQDDQLGTLVLEPPIIKQKHDAYVPWWNHRIEGAASPGDGTVPEESGRAPSGKVKFISAMTGFDHQGSYKDGNVQVVTKYCIAKIAQSAT